MTVGGPTAGDILLQEYAKLKDEQAQRISLRDNLIYATLLTLGAVVAAAAQLGIYALLALPPASTALGWTYLVNDERISRISLYIRTEIAPQLEQIVGRPMFSWETVHRQDPGRRTRKTMQFLMDHVVFVAPALTALVVFWSVGYRTVPLLLVSMIEFILVSTFMAALIRLAYLERSASIGRRAG